MKKEDVLNLMSAMEPDLIEQADVSAPARRPLPGGLRGGLIAACLCLALLGTAFAAANPEAVAALVERLSVQIFSSQADPGYSVTGGSMTKYPLSAFSPALNAASEGRDGPVVSLTFDTWEEVQAFLGEDIPCAWPQDWNTEWFQVLLFHTGSEVLWGVDVFSTDISRQATVHMEVRTELWASENASGGLGTVNGSSITQLPSYAMPNGAMAELVQITSPETVYQDGTPTGHRPQQCDGYFMRNGILYDVTAHSPVPPQESVEAQLKTVLDSFP
mgnify:CR=1 FL=1